MPAATFCRLAVSPSWPLIGTLPYDLFFRAAATPSAVLSFSARTAWIGVFAALAASMIASMLLVALVVSQASVNVPSGGLFRILIVPASTAALRPASSQPLG